MINLSREFNLFLLALGFYSRIPVPAKLAFSTELMAKSTRYIGLVGLLIGSIVALVYWVLNQFLNTELAILLAMLTSLMLTGAFHEDGLADTADGLGGAFERDKKLSIMKDSRLGTYGACALIMALMIKYQLLNDQSAVVIAILISYPLSRAIAASLIYDTEYVGLEDSKAKPVIHKMPFSDLAFMLFSASLPLLFLSSEHLLPILVLLVVCRQLAKWFFKRQLGGITGDCLGAIQQASELTIYALLVYLEANV